MRRIVQQIMQHNVIGVRGGVIAVLGMLPAITASILVSSMTASTAWAQVTSRPIDLSTSFSTSCPASHPTNSPASQPAENLNSMVQASVWTSTPVVQAGRPIWVNFQMTNLTDARLVLRVPELSAESPGYIEMGLPIEHVFSGHHFTGPMLEDNVGERYDSRSSLRPRSKEVPALILAPYGTVGTRIDMTQYYPSLTRPGQYKLTWQPYNGSVSSRPLAITVLAERQAVILTDLGQMTIRFYYDQAPNHVQNFIELIEQRFYDKLTFNRVIPGALIQGGDPQNNRRGIRPDGKRLKAEFSKIPFESGTVGMCRSMADPNSASCQFFICLGRQPNFDGQQTAFGYLVGDESFETAKRIAAVPTEKSKGMEDYPLKPVIIRAISLEYVNDRPHNSSQASSSQPAPGACGMSGSDSGMQNRPPSSIQPTTPDHSAGHSADNPATAGAIRDRSAETVRVGGITVTPADTPPADSKTIGNSSQRPMTQPAPANSKAMERAGKRGGGASGTTNGTSDTHPATQPG